MNKLLIKILKYTTKKLMISSLKNVRRCNKNIQELEKHFGDVELKNSQFYLDWLDELNKESVKW